MAEYCSVREAEHPRTNGRRHQGVVQPPTRLRGQQRQHPTERQRQDRRHLLLDLLRR